MKAQDHHIPVSVILSRFEAHQQALKDTLSALPWWKITERRRLEGAISAYQYEIKQLLEITSRWQTFWEEI